ncbi:MAG: PKD domain-containing protein [Candidatus Poseidoniaceae archaeon]|nr:PKD domain-containing protein [Candidatus Poseidoniaceae archaeon]
MKFTLSAATLVFLLVLSAASSSVLTSLNSSKSSSGDPFAIEASTTYGINEFTLVEIDEGDNDEEDVITERLHEFTFTAFSAGDVVSWDFGDGNAGTGLEVSHSFALPGHYTVTSTSTSVDLIQVVSVDLTVERKATVESDNMECVCTPTAKATVIDLIPLAGTVSYQGVVTVVHDGSSESCSLRNPLQECHVRVFLERTIDGSVVGQEVLFDGTFRSNELEVPFEFLDVEVEVGDGLQLRLETDQVRDWHKPSTEWSMTAPV